MSKPHAPRHFFPAADNQLLVNGRPLDEVRDLAGQTPFYAYDSAALTQRVRELRQQLPEAIKLHFAIKANPMPALVKHMAGLVDGLDVASAGELSVALDAGTPAAGISFAGPGKSDTDLARAIDAGVIINMESAAEMERIAQRCEATGKRARVAVRVNPDFEMKASGMKMVGGAKPFGVDAERVPAMLSRLGELDLEFVGFHIYSGSQNLQAEALVECQRQTLELAVSLAGHAPSPVTWLNIGGGLGVPYFPGEQHLDVAAVCDHLAVIAEQAQRDLPGAELVMELGRYLVAEAGIYICEIVDRKHSRGETFLVTNGGLHHHLAASGNFGQVIRKNYPVCIGNRAEASATETAHIVGPLCTPLDILATAAELPEAHPGDLVVVFQSGAYGYSASPHRFLGHPAPVEVLV